MATKPEDINPFAQYVEQPKAEPVKKATSEVNPFAKYQEYGVGTGLADASKMIAAGAIGPTTAIPLGLESAARNIPRQVLEQQGIDVPEKVGPMTFAEELVKKGPAQLFTNVAKAFVKDATGESFEKQQQRQKDNEIALDSFISRAPRIPFTESLAKYGQDKSKALTESVSDVGRARIADAQVSGNVLEAIKNRSVESLSFGKDPSVMGYALQGSQVLGSLVPVIGTALLTKSSTAVGTVGFGMGAGEAVQDAREYVNKLSDAELEKASPYFKTMLMKGIPPQEARKVVTDKAAEYAAQLQGSVAAFGDVITGKLMTGQFDKLMTGPVKNRLGRIAIGGTGGALEEGTQEFLEGVAKDIGINKSVIKEIGEESFANFVLGAMGGAGPGAYRGAVAKTVEESKNAPKPTPDELFTDLTGLPIPPTAPPAAPVAGVPPTVPPAPPAGPEAEVELEPVPSSVLAPVAAMVSTVGLDPETAQRVEVLKAELKLIDSRKTDPNSVLSESDLEFLNEREAQLAKEITDLVSPKAPETPAQTTTAEKLDNAFMWRKDGVDIPIQVIAEKLGTNENGQREILALVNGQEQSIPIDEIVRNPDFVAPVTGEAVIEPEIKEVEKQQLTIKTADETVDGRIVRKEIPNLSSIESSFNNYEILPDVKEIPLSIFENQNKPKYYSTSEEQRTKNLANQIKDSNEINPLIVAIDKDGPYILEGGHRFDALKELDAKSFPAIVVIDKDNPPSGYELEVTEAPETTPEATKEEQIAANKARQEEQKAAAEAEKKAKEEEKPTGGPAITTGGPSTPKKVAPTEEEKQAKEEEKKAREEEKKAKEEEKAQKEEQKKKIAELNTNPMKIAMETGNADKVAELLYGHAVDENLFPVIFPEEMLLRIPVETNLVSQIEEKLTENKFRITDRAVPATTDDPSYVGPERITISALYNPEKVSVQGGGAEFFNNRKGQITAAPLPKDATEKQKDALVTELLDLANPKKLLDIQSNPNNTFGAMMFKEGLVSKIKSPGDYLFELINLNARAGGQFSTYIPSKAGNRQAIKLVIDDVCIYVCSVSHIYYYNLR
jgi:hypothetical protein